MVAKADTTRKLRMCMASPPKMAGQLRSRNAGSGTNVLSKINRIHAPLLSLPTSGYEG